MTLFPHRSLARWYGANKRPLPWRRNPTPYRVWISEIMLQQTQVDTVIPYYQKFLNRFSTLQSLAQAREPSVLSLWTGLGYYSRARNLHKTAKILAKRGGRFPKTPAELLELPGIGPYTAGAIASIAFDIPAAIYDGNVRRVLSRFFLSRNDSVLKQKSGYLVQEAHGSDVRPSVFNQALMELGALICQPRNPACGVCPVRNACRARKKSVQDIYPERVKYAPTVRKFHALALLTPLSDKKKFLVVRRPETERWLKNLWEFPMTALPAAPDGWPLSGISKIFESRLGAKVAIQKVLGEVRHRITHHDLRISVFSGVAAKAPPGAKWAGAADLRRLSSSSILAKSLALIHKIL